MTKPLAADQRRYRPQEIACKACGTSCVVERPNARFCSDRCRKRQARADAAALDLVRCRTRSVARPPEQFHARQGGGLAPSCRECSKTLARLRRVERARELLVCRMCKVARPPADYYTLRGGLDRRCKACVKALAPLRRARNRFRLMN